MKLVNIIKIALVTLFSFLPAFVYAATTASAIFAAGCFWCAEHDFEQEPGVIKVISGYTGGKTKNPTYDEVSEGGSGHFEAVKVIYDPEKTSYKQLVDAFWPKVDPLDKEGQFCDKGEQYQAVIFYSTPQEKEIAEASKAALIKSGKFKKIATLILPASAFYPAEEYHQGYAMKNPIRYNFYRHRCGRDKRLEKVWGKQVKATQKEE